jgi:hypothetical protein
VAIDGDRVVIGAPTIAGSYIDSLRSLRTSSARPGRLAAQARRGDAAAPYSSPRQPAGMRMVKVLPWPGTLAT